MLPSSACARAGVEIDHNGFLTEVLSALQRRFGIRRPTLCRTP